MSSGLLVVQFVVLLLANLLSVIRYLSTLSYSSFCGSVWKLDRRAYPYFSPSVITDVET